MSKQLVLLMCTVMTATGCYSRHVEKIEPERRVIIREPSADVTVHEEPGIVDRHTTIIEKHY